MANNNYFRRRISFFAAIVAIVLCHVPRIAHAAAFLINSHPSSTVRIGSISHGQRQVAAATSVKAAGMGMGMGKTSNGKTKSKTKKNGMGNNNSNNNNNKKKVAGANFDVNASLLRLEKKYDEMLQASAKALHNSNDDDNDSDDHILSELVVAVRAAPGTASSKSKSTCDWVPVAQLCLRPHAEVSSEWVQAAVSLYCRELSHAAALGSKAFRSVPRNALQYAIEPTESFHKYVYDHLIKTTDNNSNNNNDAEEEDVTTMTMTKAQARQVLELDEHEQDKAVIKKAYRTKAFQLHPDRLRDHDAEHVQKASVEYARVQKAYERLTSGVRIAGSSWYASLGGKDRNDFKGPVSLMGRDDASAILERYKVQSAVVGLDPELIQSFVTRHQAAAGSSSTTTTAPSV